MADAARAWGFRGSVRRRSPSATGSPSCPRRTEPRSGLPGWRTWGEGRFPGRRGPRAGDLAPACHGPGEAPRDRVPEAAGDGEVDETAEGDGRRKGGPFRTPPASWGSPGSARQRSRSGPAYCSCGARRPSGTGPARGCRVRAPNAAAPWARAAGKGARNAGRPPRSASGRKWPSAAGLSSARAAAASRKKGRCVQEMQRGRTRANEAEAPGPYCRTYENRLLGPRIRLCYKTGRAGQMVPGRLPPGRRCGASRAAAAGRTEPPRRFRPKCLRCGAPAISARRQAAGETVCQACVAEVSAGLCAGCARPHEGVAESRLCRDCADTAGHAGARASPWFPGLEPRAGRSAPNGEGE